MTSATLQESAVRNFGRKRIMAFAMPAVIAAYFIYIFVAFDIAGLSERVNVSNAATLVSDVYSYKTHVTQDNRDGTVEIAIEGERKGAYPQGTGPDWVTFAEQTVIDLGGGHVVTFGDRVTYDVPGYGTISAQPGAGGVNAMFPPGDMPDYISTSKNRLMVVTDAGRFTVTRNRTEVFKYTLGWELFFFTLDSPYHGMGPAALVSAAFSGEAGAIWSDFWTNRMWRHSEVAWAIVETILMAFLGTFGAAIIALPLGFLAAKIFTPLGGLRFAARRVFDFCAVLTG